MLTPLPISFLLYFFVMSCLVLAIFFAQWILIFLLSSSCINSVNDCFFLSGFVFIIGWLGKFQLQIPYSYLLLTPSSCSMCTSSCCC